MKIHIQYRRNNEIPISKCKLLFKNVFDLESEADSSFSFLGIIAIIGSYHTFFEVGRLTICVFTDGQ